MRAPLSCTLVLIAGFGLSADDKKADPIDAKKLIGKWEPKSGKRGTSVVMEFAAGGKMVVTLSTANRSFTYTGTYTLDDRKLTMTLPDESGVHHTTVATVAELTDTVLVTHDAKGKEDMRCSRSKGKGK